MALNRNKKINIIKKIYDIAQTSLSIITADPSGIAVNKITQLRKNAIKSYVKIYLVKNTLLKKSLKNTNFNKIINVLNGPTLIAFSFKHPGSASRIFIQFNKKNKKFQIKHAVYENQLLKEKEIINLALLPTHAEAVTKFIFLLKEISLGKLIRLLHYIGHKTI
ncbi:50S ribosomal protein L10 [Buchnera aphidicola (Cinara cuneomaculata)]|uniref:Large ribosomal subunit protein uL10 n=1 Tax=Buchnera aphidicola (Cinara cuneomaculata) TaxID=1660040 RepID=A0A451CYA1_9GAMM|nr:50S ribosomal protein L10 [Buchnera aphidicola]VFP78006.1 50S ribosomal protein L10 [Buchnera aphidicola (Cinara cuneomaculata)]